MTGIAKGTFTVEMKPLSDPDTADGVSLGRMSLHKRFEGDLMATGVGDAQIEHARQSGERCHARTGHDRDRQLLRAFIHRAAVLEHEAAAAAVQRAGHALDLSLIHI